MAQSLFDRGQAVGDEDTFNNMFKKDLIEAGSIYARWALRTLDILPYLSGLFTLGVKVHLPRRFGLS